MKKGDKSKNSKNNKLTFQKQITKIRCWFKYFFTNIHIYSLR